MVINSAGVIQFMNSRMEKLLGYTKEMLGRNVSSMMPEPYSSSHDSFLRSYLKSGKPKVIGRGGRVVVAKHANGSIVPANWQPNVGHYEIYDASVRYTGIKNLGVTFGIKNLFDKEPPFSAAYDGNTGAGSSWEPRVADPRLRSFTFTLDYKFF